VKIYDCTTDNAGNITNAVVNHLNLVHISCIGHTVQFSIEKGLNVPQDPILELIHSCLTRWSSTLMLEPIDSRMFAKSRD